MEGPNPVSSAQGSTSGNSENASSSIMQYEALFRAVRNEDIDNTRKFLKEHPEALTARITSVGDTALHVAAMLGHLHIVEYLVELILENDLESVNNYGMTALQYAAYSWDESINIKIANCMVDKNQGLPAIASTNNWLPVTWALELGQIQLARYLYSVTPFEALLPENGAHGADLLALCYYSKMFDLALDLVRRCPRLVMRSRPSGDNFLVILAKTPSSYPQLPFWKRCLYSRIQVHLEPPSSLNQVVIPVSETNQTRHHHNKASLACPPGIMKEIYEAKLSDEQSRVLLRAACNAISPENIEEISKSGMEGAILMAAQRGNATLALKAQFSLLWTWTKDERRIFSVAVQYRQASVYNLFHGLTLKPLFPSSYDTYGNYMLHMAGMLAPPEQLNPIPGALLQMQRELQWFKEVESITPPYVKQQLNNGNLTPRELFTKEHKELVKEGEKWTKGTAGSCGVVAALVATITFAAAFTVPGGNDQIKGYPIFLHKNLFMLFIISDAVSLFSSTTSLLMFLGFLTSRYAEDDFLKSLPTKLIIGLSAMFISLATMMAAFCTALFLMLQHRSWIVISITFLASIPVTLYIWLQFPLLVLIFKSTYGPSIFDRNIKPWL
ncbi:hypothetical protein AHAS_Ahas19G0281500 [Arachis hypogaea]